MPSSAARCLPPTPSNRTPLSQKPKIPQWHYINTGPIILLSHRPDGKARSGQIKKIDYWISSPDTYPALTVLSVWTDDRYCFHDTVPPGSIIRLVAAQIDKRFDDDLANEILRRRFLVEGPGIAHLNAYERFARTDAHINWYYVYGHAEDSNIARNMAGIQDWGEIQQCIKIWKDWKYDGGEAKFRGLIKRKKAELEEKDKLQLLLDMEKQLKRKKEREEAELLEKMVVEGKMEESMGAYEDKLIPEKPKVFKPRKGPVMARKEEIRAEAVEEVKKITEARRMAETRWAEETENMRDQGKLWGGPSGDRFWKLDGIYSGQN